VQSVCERRIAASDSPRQAKAVGKVNVSLAYCHANNSLRRLGVTGRYPARDRWGRSGVREMRDAGGTPMLPSMLTLTFDIDWEDVRD
jgi:hypothetical protein